MLGLVTRESRVDRWQQAWLSRCPEAVCIGNEGAGVMIWKCWSQCVIMSRHGGCVLVVLPAVI